MRRVCVVITARPSYSRIRSALQALKGRVELQIIAGASALLRNYGAVVDQIRADGFNVAAEVSCVLEGGRTREMSISTGVLLTQLSGVFDALKPDMVVTIADRHETLATAIAASYQNIPLCHIQGGEVTGSIDDKVRDAVTALADVHCVSTERAGYRVQNIKPDADICVTGCPSIDLAAEAKRLGPIHEAEIVVLQHPVTTEVEQAGEQMRTTIEALKPYDDRVLWMWPGEDAGADDMSKELRLAGLKPRRHFPPVEFLRVLLGAKVLVGNSSVGIRECSYLGVPVVNIGTRQQGRERASNVFDVSHRNGSIVQAVRAAIGPGMCPESHLYGDGHAGERIADVIAGQAREAVA